MIKQGEEPIKSITVTLSGLRCAGAGTLGCGDHRVHLAGLGGLAGAATCIASAESQNDRARARGTMRVSSRVENAKSSENSTDA
jgi:hypothetical protein